MSRRRKAEKRDVIPDPRFNDRVLSRFINIVMNDGKKSTAEKIVYSALDIASSKLKIKILSIYLKVLSTMLSPA